jgi:membrane-associated phospholipid phosphatase
MTGAARYLRNFTRGLFAEAAEIWRGCWQQVITATLFTAAATVVLQGFDHSVMAWLAVHTDARLAALASKIGYWTQLPRLPLYAITVVALAGWRYRRPDWLNAALAAAVAAIAAGLFADVIKVIVSRPRPVASLPDAFYWFKMGWDYQSFPSGHAAHCCAVAAALCLAVPRCGPLFLFAAAASAWARLYIGRHYPTDLLVGAWIGIVAGAILGLAGRRLGAPSHAATRLRPVPLGNPNRST